MSIEPSTLDGSKVRLEPMTFEHAPDLLRAAGSADTFRYFRGGPPSFDTDGMRTACEALLRNPGNPP